jgi:uncharacterized protein (UPF0261 family)
MPEVDEVGSHTPKPWRVSEFGTVEGHRTDANMMAQVANTSGFATNTCETHQESAANAILIAAAPEMLDSLHELVAGLYAVGITQPRIRAVTQDALDRAKAIIAKAEGR